MISCVRDIGVELADRALLARGPGASSLGGVARLGRRAGRRASCSPRGSAPSTQPATCRRPSGSRCSSRRRLERSASTSMTRRSSLLQRVMEGQVRARLA